MRVLWRGAPVRLRLQHPRLEPTEGVSVRRSGGPLLQDTGTHQFRRDQVRADAQMEDELWCSAKKAPTTASLPRTRR